jgi:hypothetical protein
MGFEKPFLREGMSVWRLCPRFIGNLGTHNSRLALWQQKVLLFIWVFLYQGWISEEDKWIGSATLCEQYSAIYNIMRHKSDTLAKVMETSPPNVTFRRDLVGPRLAPKWFTSSSGYDLVNGWVWWISLECTREWQILYGFHVQCFDPA